uniref:Uncharacterized protein n=1 Tax=Sphaerodactylus townsendi TaxID=933632 RepID=A0ACB8FCR3_9SAUR
MTQLSPSIGKGALPKTARREFPRRDSSNSDSPPRGAQALLPAADEDDEGLVNLVALQPRILATEAGDDDVSDELPDPPGASSSRHGDVEVPVEDLDAFTLHAQHEALLRQEFDRKREALYLQLQKDHEQQERNLLQAAEQSKQELLQEVQHLRSLQLRHTEGTAAQQAERIQLQREREALARERAALLHKEWEIVDMEAQERTAVADLQHGLTIQVALRSGPRVQTGTRSPMQPTGVAPHTVAQPR